MSLLSKIKSAVQETANRIGQYVDDNRVLERATQAVNGTIKKIISVTTAESIKSTASTITKAVTAQPILTVLVFGLVVFLTCDITPLSNPDVINALKTASAV